MRSVRKGIRAVIWGNAPVMSIFVFSEPGDEDPNERSEVAVLPNPEFYLWRTDARKSSRNIYALISNDVTRPSPHDPLVGSMETATMAEIVVDSHNAMVKLYGRHFLKRLDEQLQHIE